MIDNRYLALLRGINVGGNNIIKKDELKACFEHCGFTNVKTYIQSGNILFRSNELDIATLTKTIEEALSEKFSYSAQAVVYSYEQYKAIVKAASVEWGSNEEKKHNLLFMLGDFDPQEWMDQLQPIKEDVESVSVGPGAVFWSLSKESQAKTSYMELPKKKAYKQVTIRNSNTVYKLLEMFEGI